MRRTGAILALFFCALAGCRGSEAQEVHRGGVREAERRVSSLAVEAEPVAAEAGVPWAIALVSDAPKPPAKRSGKVVVVDARDDESVAAGHEIDLYVVADPDPSDARLVDEKPVAPKSCSGVVNRRS
jgi:hypothetical protein